MKKIILTFIVFAFLANASAQLEVKSSGDTYVSKNIYLESASNCFGTTAINIPITFKLGTTLAGFTGSSGNTNVSFGYMALNSLTGIRNTAIGYQALYSNTTGGSNIAIGYNALYKNTTSGGNTALGIMRFITIQPTIMPPMDIMRFTPIQRALGMSPMGIIRFAPIRQAVTIPPMALIHFTTIQQAVTIPLLATLQMSAPAI